MKFQKTLISKLTAAALSGVMLSSACVMNTGTINAASNRPLIGNSTFDDGTTTGWGLYKESGGAATMKVVDGRLAVNITSLGKVNYAVQPNYDIIPLYKNGVYRLSMDVSSTVDRFIEGMIQQNGGTYQAYVWMGMNLTSTPQTFSKTFTMEEETDIMTKLAFNCGIQEKYEGALPEHTIYFDNVTLELLDDSKVDYNETKGYEPQIVLNQLGYRPDDKKIAVFRKFGADSDLTLTQFYASVINAETEKPVSDEFDHVPVGPIINTSADEVDWTLDFSSVTTPGKYYIVSDAFGFDASYEFEIEEDVYNDLLDESVRMLYLQRCGTVVEDNSFGHKACHDTLATIYKTNQQIDVTGGWHDAGDYGRYVVPAAKAVADLLYAYKTNPNIFSDSIGIPESGNGIPDVLDEVRYELEWMLKMQDETDGGVYHKVSCDVFPGYVMPEMETRPLIVMPKTTTSTADFAASMALAYDVYKNVDPSFANVCLEAAKKAYSWAVDNPNELYLANPADISTGAYEDKIAADEFYWAGAQLFAVTGDSSYMNGVNRKTGLDWATVGDYGNIALITSDELDKTSSEYKNVVNSIISQADALRSVSEASPYGVAIKKYNWGSNMTIANAGIILAYAYKATGDKGYIDAANAQLNYLLGTNPLGTSFVTGFGTVSPENPHHRPSMVVGKAMPGMLVGGVNSGLEDSAAKAYCQDSPAAKCWVDNSESYSTNEITIYWNSPLTYLLSLVSITEDEPDKQPLKGDVNCDNEVSAADLVLLSRYIIGTAELDEKQAANADVLEDNSVDVFDMVVLRKMIVG